MGWLGAAIDELAASRLGGMQKLTEDVAAKSQTHKAPDTYSFLNKLQPLQGVSTPMLPNFSVLIDTD
jgi:hypothetical protein